MAWLVSAREDLVEAGSYPPLLSKTTDKNLKGAGVTKSNMLPLLWGVYAPPRQSVPIVRTFS